MINQQGGGCDDISSCCVFDTPVAALRILRPVAARDCCCARAVPGCGGVAGHGPERRAAPPRLPPRSRKAHLQEVTVTARFRSEKRAVDAAGHYGGHRRYPRSARTDRCHAAGAVRAQRCHQSPGSGLGIHHRRHHPRSGALRQLPLVRARRADLRRWRLSGPPAGRDSRSARSGSRRSAARPAGHPVRQERDRRHREHDLQDSPPATGMGMRKSSSAPSTSATSAARGTSRSCRTRCLRASRSRASATTATWTCSTTSASTVAGSLGAGGTGIPGVQASDQARQRRHPDRHARLRRRSSGQARTCRARASRCATWAPRSWMSP